MEELIVKSAEIGEKDNEGKKEAQFVVELEERCEMGCKFFTGGDKKHIPECVFYPESFSCKYDEMEKELQCLKAGTNKSSGEVEEIPQEVKFENNAKKYATQIMGIGEYSERWHHGDKAMWTALMSAYKQGQRVGYYLAKEEAKAKKEYNEDWLEAAYKELPITIQDNAVRAFVMWFQGKGLELRSAKEEGKSEIPDIIVYREVSDKFPPTEMWYGVINKYGLVNQEYFNGEGWINCDTPKAWLEPVPLKSLLNQ